MYYIFCATPPVAEWYVTFLIGTLLVPGAWGLYFLPGVNADPAIRIGLGVVGFVVRDAVEKDVLERAMKSRL